MNAPPYCLACGHAPHQEECEVRLPRWRRWLGALMGWSRPLVYCSCHYWDARWERGQ